MREKHAYLRPFVGDWPILEYLKRHLSNQQAHQRKNKKRDTEGDAMEDDGSDFPPIRIARESSSEDEYNSDGNGDNEEDW